MCSPIPVLGANKLGKKFSFINSVDEIPNSSNSKPKPAGFGNTVRSQDDPFGRISEEKENPSGFSPLIVIKKSDGDQPKTVSNKSDLVKFTDDSPQRDVTSMEKTLRKGDTPDAQVSKVKDEFVSPVPSSPNGITENEVLQDGGETPERKIDPDLVMDT
jgi:hypothetical protein